VLGIGADDHHGPVPADYFAVVAAGLDGCSDFQGILDCSDYFGGLLQPVCDATAGQVVGRELHLDLVPWKDANVVLAHLPRDRREDVVAAAVELDAKHRARERLRDLAFDLDLLFLACQSPSFVLERLALHA